jgi:hypothetical protein
LGLLTELLVNLGENKTIDRYQPLKNMRQGNSGLEYDLKRE